MAGKEKKQPGFIIRTLGCKVNQYDSERLRSQLMRRGYRSLTDNDGGEPQLIVINTCSVTSESDRKGRQLIRKLIRRYPNARVMVTGCYSERYPGVVGAIEGVDEIVPIVEQEAWVERITEEPGWGCDDRDALWEPSQGIEIFQEHTRAFVKIQDGCDLKCTFCSIPDSRGAARSRTPDEFIPEIQHLVEQGYPEIVLCGVCLGDFGRDIGMTLHEVVRTAAEIDGIKRVRISSLEPQHATDDLFTIMASHCDVICPHLHLPLQSGSDRILRRMKRPYTVDYFAERIEKARSLMPDFEVSTDLMAGFPGETEDDFEKTLEAVRRIRFSKVHSFRFSERRGTPASRMKNSLPSGSIEARRKKLDEIALAVVDGVKKSYIGRTVPVLSETRENGMNTGFTPNYLKTIFHTNEDVKPGSIADVKITSVENGRLVGIAGDSNDRP